MDRYLKLLDNGYKDGVWKKIDDFMVKSLKSLITVTVTVCVLCVLCRALLWLGGV